MSARAERTARTCPECGKSFKPMTGKVFEAALKIHRTTSKQHKRYLDWKKRQVR
ncbi:MAG: hypothetical protein KGI38_00530 [Thaumarchaeota archaeon]|nr:hypothetical protein [Nitrososphaerota archaeon]